MMMPPFLADVTLLLALRQKGKQKEEEEIKLNCATFREGKERVGMAPFVVPFSRRRSCMT